MGKRQQTSAARERKKERRENRLIYLTHTNTHADIHKEHMLHFSHELSYMFRKTTARAREKEGNNKKKTDHEP